MHTTGIYFIFHCVKSNSGRAGDLIKEPPAKSDKDQTSAHTRFPRHAAKEEVFVCFPSAWATEIRSEFVCVSDGTPRYVIIISHGTSRSGGVYSKPQMKATSLLRTEVEIVKTQ